MVDETENVTDQLVDGTYTFVDVIENHTIAATFEEIHTYTIIVLSNNDAYGFVSDGGTFEEGVSDNDWMVIEFRRDNDFFHELFAFLMRGYKSIFKLKSEHAGSLLILNSIGNQI